MGRLLAENNDYSITRRAIMVIDVLRRGGVEEGGLADHCGLMAIIYGCFTPV